MDTHPVSRSRRECLFRGPKCSTLMAQPLSPPPPPPPPRPPRPALVRPALLPPALLRPAPLRPAVLRRAPWRLSEAPDRRVRDIDPLRARFHEHNSGGSRSDSAATRPWYAVWWAILALNRWGPLVASLSKRCRAALSSMDP